MNLQNQPLVTLSHNRLVTTSLKVADHFGKTHKYVLEAQRNLDCSEEFRRLNFRLSSYKNVQNKSQPMYELTHDGFMFLCMGFTGANAAHWKERFISEFNRMALALNTKAAAQADLFTQPAPDLSAKMAELEASLAHSLEKQSLLMRLADAQAMVVALSAKPTKRVNKPSKPLTATEMASMRQLYAQGLSVTAIAKKLGRSTASVSWATRTTQGDAA